MHASLPLTAMHEVTVLRGEPKIERVEAQALTDNFAAKYHNRQRNQVDGRAFLQALNETEVMQHYPDAGKIILLDSDLYVGRLNWCFGSMTSTLGGLGYIVLSTNRMKDTIHAKDIIRHELGHMFKAPSQGRRNTKESLGLHCTMSDCVMQQKLDVREAIRYAHQRSRKSSPIFCPDCEKDLRAYVAPR